MISQEEAVDKFTSAILLRAGNVIDEFRRIGDQSRPSFAEIAEDAAMSLTKEEVVAILFFIISDYEVFFDVFSKSVDRRAAASG